MSTGYNGAISSPVVIEEVEITTQERYIGMEIDGDRFMARYDNYTGHGRGWLPGPGLCRRCRKTRNRCRSAKRRGRPPGKAFPLFPRGKDAAGRPAPRSR